VSNSQTVAEGAPKRFLFTLAAALVTAGILLVVLLLGGWAYNYRRLSLHEGRLTRLLEKHPTVAPVLQALRAEGGQLLDSPSGEPALSRAAARWGSSRAAEVVQKGSKWPQTRVVRVGDMIYFLYFDSDGVLRDFTSVGEGR